MLTQQKLTRPKNICDLAARLAALGYFPVPIPKGCKGPTLAGWDKLHMRADEAPQYFTEPEMLVGALHQNLACFDIDVYDADLAAEIVAEGFRRFPGALERIGAAPKSAIVLRLDEPGFKVHNTEKHSVTSDDGEVIEAQVEVRTLTRQMVVYGKHPDTGKPYRWPRGELWETPRDSLPPLTKADAEAFRDWCNARIRQWAGVEKQTATIVDLGDYRAPTQEDRPGEEEFLEALHHVPSDLGYEAGWLQTLMAIHDYYSGGGRGLDVAKDWSSSDPRYSAKEVEAKWRSFEVGKGVGYKTVFGIAKQHGMNMADLTRRHRVQAESVRQSDPTVTQFRDMTDEEKDAVPPLMFAPWRTKDLSAIPVPEFLYSDFYARKYTSVTLAAPKVGKSMLGLAEAMDMATGKGFLTGVERAPLIVVYYNAEDDQDVMDARVAALLTHYDIPQSAIDGRFYPVSGVGADDFYMMSGDSPTINEPLFVGLEKFCVEAKADVLIFDPLQDMTRSPETNEAFRLLGQRLRRMANKAGVALGLIHHTRKVAPGVTPSIDDMRGGSALRGTARFNRILVSMTEDESVKAGVANHRHYMRVGDMESNLAPPSSEINQWYQKISVLAPNGHYVGAVEKWEWPDAFDGISRQDAAKVRAAIAGMAEPPRLNVRSPDWAGVIVADIVGLDISDKTHKARVQFMLSTWIKTDILAVAKVPNSRAGRDIEVVVPGQNNPLSEA